MLKYMFLNLPNPPNKNIYRGNAGGFGTTGTISSKTLLPIYLIYAASALENSGCKYEILDAQAMEYDVQKVKKEVIKREPDILLAWISLPSFYHDLKCLDEVKSLKEDTLIVAWGTVCNVMPEEILFNSKVDLILKGEYPYYYAISTFIEKVEQKGKFNFEDIPSATFVKNGKIFSNPSNSNEADSLNKLSLKVYHRISVHNYVDFYESLDGSKVGCIPIITSAGCPYSCMYCPYPIGYGKRVKYKSVENIIKEIEFLIENFGVNGFLFRDQVFTQNKKRVVELCNKIIEKNLDIKWLIEARADQMSRELLQLMKRAGCFRIHFGVETGSSKLIDLGKPGSDLEKYKNAFNVCREFGIFTIAHLIIGLPGESQETIQDTLKFLRYINPDKINLNIITPYPGTELFEMAKEKGWIMDFDWSKYTSFNAVMRTEDLTTEQINELRQYIKKEFRKFKLIHDGNYRKLLIRSIPRKLRDRLILKLVKIKT